MLPISTATSSATTSAVSPLRTTQNNASSAVNLSAEKPTEVSISGRSIMLSRLFLTNDPNAEPKIENNITGNTMSGSVYSFLTREDRVLVSKLYEYAAQKGFDLDNVDAFAFDLGGYRLTEGVLFESVNYDSQTGEPQEIKFTEADEAAAQRMHMSKAIGNSEIDQDFLRELFNPYMHGHAVSFEFLEEVLYAFSPSGDEVDPSAKPLIRKEMKDYPPYVRPEDGNAQEKGKGVAMFEKRLFGQGASKAVLAEYLNDTDKAMLSDLYAKAAKKGASEEELKRIDKKAYSLAAMRMRAEMMQSYWEKDAAFKSKINEVNQADKTDKANKTDDKTLGKTQFPLAESYGKSSIFAPFATPSAAEEKSSSIKDNELKKDAP